MFYRRFIIGRRIIESYKGYRVRNLLELRGLSKNLSKEYKKKFAEGQLFYIGEVELGTVSYI